MTTFADSMFQPDREDKIAGEVKDYSHIFCLASNNTCDLKIAYSLSGIAQELINSCNHPNKFIEHIFHYHFIKENSEAQRG